MRKVPALPLTLAAVTLLLAGLSGSATGAPGGDETSDPAEFARLDPYGDAYVIGIEDLLQISVWKNADLSMSVPVRPDGKISLPLIDDVQAAGLTPTELKKTLTSRWTAFVTNPEVSVIVKEINSFKVYLVGEVARPGELKLKDRTTLIQAISLAGGFTAFAHPDDIVVLRPRKGVSDQRFEINFKKVVSGSRADDNILLHPGDTVIVP